MSRVSFNGRNLGLCAFAALAFAIIMPAARASVLYATPNSLYTQNFDSLPITPENASLQTTVPWIDDSTSSATQTSIPGWYLWHALNPGAESGTNGHQRLRIGTGSGNTGSFYSFGATGATERALGSVGSTTIATNPGVTNEDTRVLTALRLTNGTGQTLGSFTLTYTGEQWRDGGSTTPAPETLLFDYSLNAAAPQDTAATFTSVPSLNFTTPVFVNTGSGAAVDGNAAGNRQTLTATVSGLNWAPGTDLWLRWDDPQRAGNDHGVAIDDLSFTSAVAVPEPGTCASLIGVAAAMLARRRPR